MNIPKSINEWNALAESEKIKFVESETDGQGGPGDSGYLIYEQWALNYTRSATGELINMEAETLAQALRRLIGWQNSHNRH